MLFTFLRDKYFHHLYTKRVDKLKDRYGVLCAKATEIDADNQSTDLISVKFAYFPTTRRVRMTIYNTQEKLQFSRDWWYENLEYLKDMGKFDLFLNQYLNLCTVDKTADETKEVIDIAYESFAKNYKAFVESIDNPEPQFPVI